MNGLSPTTRPAQQGLGAASAPSPVPRISSRELLRGRRELVIEHQGQEYRLILTRNDKLILNK